MAQWVAITTIFEVCTRKKGFDVCNGGKNGSGQKKRFDIYHRSEVLIFPYVPPPNKNLDGINILYN